ncbi:MAG: HAD family hydrolase [Candidatus Thorarchaeota archaeon]
MHQSTWKNYALLFDMDGVLISLKSRWIDPIEEVISKVKPNYDLDTIRNESPSLVLVTDGRSSSLMFQGILQVCKVAGLNNFQTFRVIIRLSSMLITRKKFKIVPFEGVSDILKNLRKMGFRLALVTSASRRTIKNLKKQFPDLYNKFDCVVTRNDVKLTKPFPDQIHIALKKLQIKKEKAVIIGDFASDIKAGKNAGVRTVAVLSEYPQENKKILEKTNPDFIVDTISEIPEMVSEIFVVNK